MKSNIFIPNKINVGFQERSGTYTGKLAYVIYYDEKGVLRKETSWNGWRDKNIPNEEFENVPTEGFVLNKKAGDYSTGWNHRQAYCRVYDPRNFEFEITIENLLYILENTDSIRGKGLNGQFVYGWCGKDLILIPVESPDYKEFVTYSSIVKNNESIKAKDLIIGATYLTKDNTEYVYMGKFDYYDCGYEWIEDDQVKQSKNYGDIPVKETSSYYSWNRYSKINYKRICNLYYEKRHWFCKKEIKKEWIDSVWTEVETDNWDFEYFKTIPKNKFIKCVDEKCHDEYANMYNSMEGSHNFSPYDKEKNAFAYMSFEEFYKRARNWNDTEYTSVEFISNCLGVENNYKIEPVSDKYRCYENKFIVVKNENAIDLFETTTETIKEMVPTTLEKIYEVMKPQYVQKYLANGREYEKEYRIHE